PGDRRANDLRVPRPREHHGSSTLRSSRAAVIASTRSGHTFSSASSSSGSGASKSSRRGSPLRSDNDARTFPASSKTRTRAISAFLLRRSIYREADRRLDPRPELLLFQAPERYAVAHQQGEKLRAQAFDRAQAFGHRPGIALR